MGRSAFRKMVSCVLVFLFPGAMFAADSNAAMLYTNGAAWVNGAHVPRSASSHFLRRSAADPFRLCGQHQ